MADKVVRAAGGVVWRRRDDGEVEILLVHRPKYDDWSYPKGKCSDGEDDETCALREVEEETGLACELHDELPSIEYIDPKGRPKKVRYWAMTVRSGTFVPNDETDAVRWEPVARARSVLAYPHDRTVLAALAERL